MCAACWSSESSSSVWTLSISTSSTAQHWDSSPTCSEWPPPGSRHSLGSNTRSTSSQCCIWFDWPSVLTSYTGIIIWYQRQGFILVPILSNRLHSTSSDQEINIWVARVKIWCATGSVLDPILFTIYTTPLGQLIRRHGLTFHLYADDTQLNLAFKPSETSSIVNNVSRLEKCVDDIRAVMKLNLLKLNGDKTELLVITYRPSTSYSLHISINVGDQYISPSEEPPKNFGVIFYSTCSL